MPVELTEKDFNLARSFVDRTRSIIEGTIAPGPLEDSPKCSWCSHVSVCLPDEHLGRVTSPEDRSVETR